ncbi:MAG: LysR family transcriptional regulator [Polyangiales bacterium]
MDALPPLDWRDLALLLALRRAGSLAGAAKALGVDATTVGRRVRVLEAAVGAPLMTRKDRAVSLTEVGEALVAVAEATERGVTEVRRRVALEREAPRGVVRLTTMEVLASRFVAPALPKLLRAHPGLLLEIDTSPKIRDLARGEADIALRLSRPEEPTVVRRSIGAVSLSGYVIAGPWADDPGG